MQLEDVGDEQPDGMSRIIGDVPLDVLVDPVPCCRVACSGNAIPNRLVCERFTELDPISGFHVPLGRASKEGERTGQARDTGVRLAPFGIAGFPCRDDDAALLVRVLCMAIATSSACGPCCPLTPLSRNPAPIPPVCFQTDGNSRRRWRNISLGAVRKAVLPARRGLLTLRSRKACGYRFAPVGCWQVRSSLSSCRRALAKHRVRSTRTGQPFERIELRAGATDPST
jgi:hypothetical protein